MQFWDLFQWWNLLFTLPFGVGLLPLLLQAAGATHFTHSGHAHFPHASGHTHAAAHGHATHPAHGTTSDAPAHARANLPARLLSILGIGKVPIMLVFSIFCLIWGATGVTANQVFSKVLRIPALYVWPSSVCAFLVSYFATGGLSQWIARIMPELETYGTDEESLVGRTARAAYALGATPGSAFLLDDRQNRIQVRCRTHDGSAIPGGAEVLLLEYDPQSRIFTVVRLQREQPPAAGSRQTERPARQSQKMKLQ